MSDANWRAFLSSYTVGGSTISEEDHGSTLQEIGRLWDVEPGTPESDTLEILVTLGVALEAPKDGRR